MAVITSQQQATQYGRKIKPRYAEMIMSQAPYAPQLMESQANLEHMDTMEGIAQQNLDLLDQIQSANQQDAKTAQALGWAGVGVNALGSVLENKGRNDILNKATSFRTPTPQSSSLSMSRANEFTAPGVSTGPTTTLQKVGAGANRVWQAAKNPTTLLAGGIGAGAGHLTKGSDIERAMVGAGVGAAANWLLSGGPEKLFTAGEFGGDWLSTSLSSVMGGALSFL